MQDKSIYINKIVLMEWFVLVQYLRVFSFLAWGSCSSGVFWVSLDNQENSEKWCFLSWWSQTKFSSVVFSQIFAISNNVSVQCPLFSAMLLGFSLIMLGVSFIYQRYCVLRGLRLFKLPLSCPFRTVAEMGVQFRSFCSTTPQADWF